MNVLMVHLWDVLHTSKNKMDGNGTLTHLVCYSPKDYYHIAEFIREHYSQLPPIKKQEALF